ncbi:MAG: hypothetical protein MJ212_05085 [Alphaproteobacteria bacterium]|nr:hypothetical protein [Alphaproteobacteria bacterium]
MQKARQANSGRSMVEMMGVLAIASVLSIGGLAGYTKMMNQYKINKSIEQISNMAAKISTIGSQSSSYEGLSNQSAVKFNAVPSEAVIGNGTSLENAFGGAIVISSAPLFSDGTDTLAYTITYTGLPEDVCIALGSHDWAHGSNMSLIGVGVAPSADGAISAANKLYQKCPGQSGGGYAVACSDGSAVKVPLRVSVAAETCECGGNSCAVVLKYF